MIEDITNLPQVVKNLRYLLYLAAPDTSCWERVIHSKIGCGIHRAGEILAGEEPNKKELWKIAEWCGRSPDDVGSAPIYPSDRDGLLKENVRFLLSCLAHGMNSKLAASLNVKPVQVSRWKSGKQLPPKKTQADLLRYFALDPGTDLTGVPLFLASYPIHAQAQRDWLIHRLQEISNEDLSPHFQSIRKLISPR